MDLILYSPYTFLAAYLSLLPLSLVVYRLYLHPLAKVPGPRLAAIRTLWYVYHIRQSRMGVFNQALHKKYGPMVRIGPHEVSVDSKEGFQAIYTGSQYTLKGDFYWALSFNPGTVDWRFRRHQGDTFALNGEMDMERYRRHRRNIGTTYSASSMKKYGERLDEVMTRFVAKLRTQEGQVVDLTDWMHIAVLECLSALTLNWSPGLFNDGEDRGHLAKSTLAWREMSALGYLQAPLLVVQKWPLLRPIVAKLLGVGIKLPEGYVPFEPQPYKIIQERSAAFVSGEKPAPPSSEPDILTDLLAQTTKRPDWKPHYAAGMARTNFIAGHETTTSALTSALAEICSNAAVKARVQAELRSAASDAKDTNVDLYSDSCRYSGAALKEALRIHPVVNLALPRKVPPAGPPLTLHGVTLPPGTTVGVNASTLHVNPDIFGADAAEFRPERWLESPEAWRTMEKTSLAWGGGPHTCPGRNLAELIMGKILVAVLGADGFDMKVVERMPEREMRSSTYLSIPTGVKVVFERREERGRVEASGVQGFGAQD